LYLKGLIISNYSLRPAKKADWRFKICPTKIVVSHAASPWVPPSSYPHPLSPLFLSLPSAWLTTPHWLRRPSSPHVCASPAEVALLARSSVADVALLAPQQRRSDQARACPDKPERRRWRGSSRDPWRRRRGHVRQPWKAVLRYMCCIPNMVEILPAKINHVKLILS
jgi:hypothetical protein